MNQSCYISAMFHFIFIWIKSSRKKHCSKWKAKSVTSSLPFKYFLMIPACTVSVVFMSSGTLFYQLQGHLHTCQVPLCTVNFLSVLFLFSSAEVVCRHFPSAQPHQNLGIIESELTEVKIGRKKERRLAKCGHYQRAVARNCRLPFNILRIDQSMGW